MHSVQQWAAGVLACMAFGGHDMPWEAEAALPTGPYEKDLLLS